MGYTYSRWDGSQSPGTPDADSLLEALADKLLLDSDVDRILERAVREGLDLTDGSRLKGLTELARIAEERCRQSMVRTRNGSAGNRTESPSDENMDTREASSAPSASMHPENGEASSPGVQIGAERPHSGPPPDREGQPAGNRGLMSARASERRVLARIGSYSGASTAVANERDVASTELPTIDGSSGLFGESGTDERRDSRSDSTIEDLSSLRAALTRAAETGDLSSLDSELVRLVLGTDAARTVESLGQLRPLLDEAGFMRQRGARTELSPAGARKIGDIALQQIFSRLRAAASGDHAAPGSGSGAELSELSRPPQFGDPFVLDLHRTMMNAVTRQGAGAPVRLTPSDFEIISPEKTTRSATVLMLDTSRSMPARGCSLAALKVTLALNALIRARFPRDFLSILAFSGFARIIHPGSLHLVRHSDRIQGTNMQHGFMVARRLLGRYRSGSRQIILITDGEPTAHLHGGAVRIGYPPSTQTLEATLREAHRCAREGIAINTFMLGRNDLLTQFIARMTRINHGRVFFTTPENLGEAVVGEYLDRKKWRRFT